MSVGTFSLEVPTVTDGVDSLLSADAPAWERAKEVVVAVEPTPLDRLPSAYVQASWRDRPRSAVGQVHVRAAAGSDGLALRLDWTAARPVRRIDDVNAYPDACAVLFPADGREADFGTMGSPEHPVRGWHWRAGSDPPFVVTATGIGTVERIDGQAVQGRASWTGGRWQVVLAGPLGAEGLPLGRGSALPVAFAVWSGAARQRAGLKAFSPQPCELRLA